MAEPIDHRILTARLEPSVRPAGIEKPTPTESTPALQPGQPTFVEILERAAAHLADAEKRIPDPSRAQNARDVESQYEQLGALHQMTMEAHLIISQLGQQIVNPEEQTSGQEEPPAG
jgi:hypothetical protein